MFGDKVQGVRLIEFPSIKKKDLSIFYAYFKKELDNKINVDVKIIESLQKYVEQTLRLKDLEKFLSIDALDLEDLGILAVNTETYHDFLYLLITSFPSDKNIRTKKDMDTYLSLAHKIGATSMVISNIFRYNFVSEGILNALINTRYLDDNMSTVQDVKYWLQNIKPTQKEREILIRLLSNVDTLDLFSEFVLYHKLSRKDTTQIKKSLKWLDGDNKPVALMSIKLKLNVLTINEIADQITTNRLAFIEKSDAKIALKKYIQCIEPNQIGMNEIWAILDIIDEDIIETEEKDLLATLIKKFKNDYKMLDSIFSNIDLNEYALEDIALLIGNIISDDLPDDISFLLYNTFNDIKFLNSGMKDFILN